MKVYPLALCFLLIILFEISAKLEPTTFAYLIDYEGESCRNHIAVVNIFPVYGSNGTCLQSSIGAKFNYMKIVCGKDSATINLMCTENCQYCDYVKTWKFNKNECGVQDVGCGKLPQISVPLMYNSFFDYSQNECSGNLVNIQGESLNTCERVTGHSFEVLTCNQTMWTRKYYEQDDSTCSPNNYSGYINGPINTCKHDDNSKLSCGKL